MTKRYLVEVEEQTYMRIRTIAFNNQTKIKHVVNKMLKDALLGVEQ